MNETPREALSAAILFRIEQEVREAILQDDLSEDSRKAILEELLSNSTFILESLTIQDLQNEFAIQRHVEKSIATATYFVHRIAAQRSRS